MTDEAEIQNRIDLALYDLERKLLQLERSRLRKRLEEIHCRETVLINKLCYGEE
jgi:hypothetical protein